MSIFLTRDYIEASVDFPVRSSKTPLDCH